MKSGSSHSRPTTGFVTTRTRSRPEGAQGVPQATEGRRRDDLVAAASEVHRQALDLRGRAARVSGALDDLDHPVRDLRRAPEGGHLPPRPGVARLPPQEPLAHPVVGERPPPSVNLGAMCAKGALRTTTVAPSRLTRQRSW